MDHPTDLTIRYDTSVDTLYMSMNDRPAAKGVEDHMGCVWRYDEAGTPIGVTVVDFLDHWMDRLPQLEAALSDRLHVPQPQAQSLLDRAVREVRY